jgi:predicted transcriptional regulator
MTTMSSKSQAIRLKMHEWLATEQDEKLVEAVSIFVEQRKNRWATIMNPMTKAQQAREIKAGLEDLANGRVYTMEEVEEEMKTW